MLRKSLLSGLLIGILLALVTAFAVNDEIVRVIPKWEGITIPGLPYELIRDFSLAAAGVLLLFVGTLAAMRVRPKRLKDGVKAGALSGLVAGIIVYAFVLSLLTGLRGAGKVYWDLQNNLTVDPELYYRRVTAEVWQTSLRNAFLIPLLGLVLGGLEGFVYTLIRRLGGRPAAEEEAEPALLDLVRQEEPLRGAAGRGHVLRAGLLGGMIVGVFLCLEGLLLFAQELADWGELAIHPRGVSEEIPTLIARLSVPLFVVLPLAIIFWGGSGVLLLKRPPSRFGSRFLVSMFSGATACTIFITLIVVPVLNVGVALGPLIIHEAKEAALELEELHLMVRGAIVAYPVGLLVVLLLVGLLLGFFLGLPFVLSSAFVWPRRPVDRAASLARRLARQPNTLLPQIYALFQKDRQAEEVLLHLTQRFNQDGAGPAAITAAAYHTLCRHPEQADALQAIVDTLAETTTWRWRTEIGELHRFLHEGLLARSIHHLAAIRPLPEEQTSSLPAVLRQAGKHLSCVVAKVKKAHQLDDPNSRTIYLNHALEAIAEAEHFTVERMTPLRAKDCASPYPEQAVLSTLLSQWQAVIHETLRDLRGRAVLQIELQTKKATYMPRLPLRFRVANEGLNVAEQVRIGLSPGSGYHLTPQSEARIELLPPGEAQVVELAVEPRSPRPMRVLLHIIFNDAVEGNRELSFADEVVFVETERPFTRIFPIPYVTGTPLKTSEMFFGRQDVFAYVREHLLGAYQNNIIVLHGQRRTGKTSVLYQLPEVLEETHYCALIDMQGVAARSESEFFYGLSDEIAYALERRGLQVGIPPREDYDAQPEFTFRARFLRGLYPALGEKHLLLLFDEFEELQYHVEEGHIGDGIFSFMRNLMQHEEKVDFVFSGTHKLEELAAEYWSILFNIATYKKVSFLERNEAERLIIEPVASYGMEYDPMAVEHIHGVTAGHPFLTQLVCHEMVAYHNETERNYITVADVDVVLERIAERGEAHFKFVWSEAEPTQRAVLLALAELLVHTDAATLEEVVALSGRRGRYIGEEAAVSALVRLESRDVVARTAPGSERFRFRVDLVRRWIVRNPQLADTVTLG